MDNLTKINIMGQIQSGRGPEKGSAMPKPSYRTLIADADNTLYSWVDYIVPCLEAMVDTLEKLSGFPRERIVESIKQVFEARQTNEYAFVLQEAEIFAPLRRDLDWFQKVFITPTRYVFNRVRLQNLRLYPGVRKTFHRLVDRGVEIYVLSDAPAFSAEQRLKHLGLDHCIKGLYALESYPVPESHHLDENLSNRIRIGYYRSRIGKVVELPLELEKPNPAGLRFLLEQEEIDPRTAILVGDNPKKDVRVARETGVLDVWARYGTLIAPETREKLRRYSAPSVHRRNVSTGADDSLVPNLTIDRFDEILPLFGA